MIRPGQNYKNDSRLHGFNLGRGDPKRAERKEEFIWHIQILRKNPSIVRTRTFREVERGREIIMRGEVEGATVARVQW
jgi:hypothetical protein